MNIWNQTFGKFKSAKRNKGRPLSDKQLQAACEVFGPSISPQCEPDNTKSVTLPVKYKQDGDVDLAQLAQTIIAMPEFQELMSPIMEQVNDLATDLEILEGQAADIRASFEAMETEKKMFTSRIGTMFAQDPAMSLSSIGNKDAPAQGRGSWIDDMSNITKHHTDNKNIYSAHDTTNGKTRK